jgi:hypothetical protein
MNSHALDPVHATDVGLGAGDGTLVAILMAEGLAVP